MATAVSNSSFCATISARSEFAATASVCRETDPGPLAERLFGPAVQFVGVADVYHGNLRLGLVDQATQEEIAVLREGELAQLHRGLLPGEHLGPANQADGLHALRADDLDPHFTSGHGHQLPQLLGEYLRQPFRVLDVVVVRVARLGQTGHQVLVIVVADANGGHRDAAFGEGTAQLPQVPRRAGTDIGKAVGEQDDAIDSPARQVPLELRCAELDSGIKGSAAARADVGNPRS